MAPEDTFIDPPATPAHLFVWRAITGAVVGSPATPPEHNNKENVSPIRQHAKTVGRPYDKQMASPLKRKRDNATFVSPTKSILRTPGALTPRAKSLREINVKFKSVSPELRIKEASKKQQVLSENNLKKIAEIGTDYCQSVMVEHEILPSIEQPQISNDDFESYRRRTEKEVKKLLRQNQKLREYGRQADIENMRIQKLLEDAQRENRSLNATLASTETRLQNALAENRVLKGGKEDSSRDTLGPQEQSMQSRRASESHPSVQHPASHSRFSGPASTTTTTQMPPPPRPRPSSTTLQAGPLQTPAATHRSPLTSLAYRLEGGPPPPSTTQRTNIPPRRVNEIRQRLASKAEKRKASGISTMGDSMIDWAALGR